MSRFAGVVVIARNAGEVMEPLTRPDEDREWWQCFTEAEIGMFDAWTVEFHRGVWHGILARLESLPWPDPQSVQVLIGDEEDDCCGLWMMYDGRLVEVPLPHTRRDAFDGHPTGLFNRTDYRP